MTGTTIQNIDDMAVRWAARKMSNEMTPEEESALEAWLSADPSHREAFGAYIEVADLAVEADDAMVADALSNELSEFANSQTTRRSWLVAAPAMAASIAAAAFFFTAMSDSPTDSMRYATSRGETKEIRLADGSTVSLNTDSVLEVAFESGARNVSLTKGEALFDVVRDSSRPFVVATSGAETRVLGTKFNVRATSAETIVSVLSGVVEVGAAEASENLFYRRTVTLIAGQEAVVNPMVKENNVREFNPDWVTSWMRGKVYYENQPLITVLNDLNRYYDTEFVLADEALGAIPVSGGFDLKNQAITQEALSVALSLQADRNAIGQIVLSQDE